MGYATTVDKAQGCTIIKLIVNTFNFWRAAQIAVAIGRAISKLGLQVLNYNKFAAHLKHPAIVHNFYESPSIGMSAKMTCCKFRAHQIPAHDVRAFALQIAAPGNVNLMQGTHNNVIQSDMNERSIDDLEIDFPYNVSSH